MQADTGHVRITLNVGTKDSAGEPIPPAVRYDALQHVYSVLADTFGGASSYEGFGVWRNDIGAIIEESNTFVYSYAPAVDVDALALEALAADVARRLAQESVLLTIEPVSLVSFVGAPAPAESPADDSADDVCVCSWSRCVAFHCELYRSGCPHHTECGRLQDDDVSCASFDFDCARCPWNAACADYQDSAR